MSDLASATPDETLDTLGRVCPYPLLLTKKKMEKIDGTWFLSAHRYLGEGEGSA